MTTSWALESGNITIAGIVEEPADGAAGPVPFDADFPARVLRGLVEYLVSPRPWDLWVAADGGFDRDGGRCAIVALQFGWSTFGGSDEVVIVATVRHDTAHDVTANEPQPLVTFSGADLDRLRATVFRLHRSRVAESAYPRSVNPDVETSPPVCPARGRSSTPGVLVR